MPDVDQRLDDIEQNLKDLGERIDERFAQVDQRFAQVDQRFAQVDQRFAQVDKQLNQLQVLGEENTTQIRLIAEVQSHHGNVQADHGAALKRLEEAVEPLKVLPDAIQRVVGDHERRISALEQATRHRPDA